MKGSSRSSIRTRSPAAADGDSISAGWNGTSFEAAAAAPPGDKERTRLVGDLIGAFFRSYHNVAAGQDEAYLDLDKGLAVISQHAQALGYDALILFLDELILWLASHAADLSFIHRETQKLVKLVEAQNVDRPIPLVSFVARQRDLRKLIGDTVPGAQKLNFDDSVDWSEGRFGVIKLEDRNLPMIANKRVLKPRSEAARQELDASFEETAKIRKEVMDTLLANEYDREMFRLIYPFSPALMETLICCVEHAATRAHGAEGDDAAPGGAAGNAQGRRHCAGGRPVRCRGAGRRSLQPGHEGPLRQRPQAVPRKAAADAGGRSTVPGARNCWPSRLATRPGSTSSTTTAW